MKSQNQLRRKEAGARGAEPSYIGRVRFAVRDLNCNHSPVLCGAPGLTVRCSMHACMHAWGLIPCMDIQIRTHSAQRTIPAAI